MTMTRGNRQVHNPTDAPHTHTHTRLNVQPSYHVGSNRCRSEIRYDVTGRHVCDENRRPPPSLETSSGDPALSPISRVHATDAITPVSSKMMAHMRSLFSHSPKNNPARRKTRLHGCPCGLRCHQSTARHGNNQATLSSSSSSSLAAHIYSQPAHSYYRMQGRARADARALGTLQESTSKS